MARKRAGCRAGQLELTDAPRSAPVARPPASLSPRAAGRLPAGLRIVRDRIKGGSHSGRARAEASPVMTRRAFLDGLVLLAAPRAAEAQRPGKPPTIGVLGSGTASAQSQWTTAFVQRLRELGWTEGGNVAIEYRWAEGRSERFADIAAEFVRLGVDVILTHNTPPTLAAKRATSVIPIVFATAGDPVGSGIVASLARPGGNVTGLSSQAPDTASKKLELLREVVPALQRFGTLADVGNPFAARDVEEVRQAARAVGLEVRSFEIKHAADLDRAFEALKGRVQALYVVSVPILFVNRARINSLAAAARLPTMHGVREYVEAGGLMSYGPSWPHMWSRAADLVDKILRGAQPAGIPVEQPTKFELVINVKTAKALGLTIPPALLQRADQVIG
jgi:putative tryptophan/tyrosine transport system substrate-binding protein